MAHQNLTLLSTEDIAKYLHISVGTVKNRLSKGDPMPPSIKIGRRQLFPSKEFHEWLSDQLVTNDGKDNQGGNND